MKASKEAVFVCVLPDISVVWNAAVLRGFVTPFLYHRTEEL